MITFAGVVAAAIFAAVAAFQITLAAGAPWGGLAWGGARDGRLPAPMRLGSGVAVVVLMFFALIILAQAGVTSWSPVPTGALRAISWAIAGFMALNTLGNLVAKSRFERFVMGSATAILVVACIIVAIGGAGPT